MSNRKKQDNAQDRGAEKEKKVKIVYYDDGSTVADMSGTKRKAPMGKTTFREKMRTFFGVMKRMVLPMLCTLTAFTLIYIILLAITGKL